MPTHPQMFIVVTPLVESLAPLVVGIEMASLAAQPAVAARIAAAHLIAPMRF